MDENGEGRFEELDPEPTRARGRRRWEAGLAAMLLIVILGFAGWNWLHGTIATATYRQAVAAVDTHHWAAAQAAFVAAGAYQDAPARAAAAAKQVQYLDQTYAQLQAAQQASNWLRAWHLAAAI